MKMEQCSETSAYLIQTSGNYLEENIQLISCLLLLRCILTLLLSTRCFGSSMSHLQVDHFFLSKVNRTISNAIVIVTYEISYNIYKIEVKLIPLCNGIEIISGN